MFKLVVILSVCVLSFGFPQDTYIEENWDGANYIPSIANSFVERQRRYTQIPSQLYLRAPVNDENEYDPDQVMTVRHRREANPDGNDNNRGSASVDVQRSRGGTDLRVEGKTKVWESQDRRSTVEANSFYDRHYGGRDGTSRPNYGGGVTFTHRF